MVAADAHIRENALSLKTENVIEVVHRQWTVKPARTKHWPGQLESSLGTPAGGWSENSPGTPTGGQSESSPGTPTGSQLERSHETLIGDQVTNSPTEPTEGQLDSPQDGLGTELRSSQTGGGVSTPHTCSGAVPAYIARPSHRQDPHTGQGKTTGLCSG